MLREFNSHIAFNSKTHLNSQQQNSYIQEEDIKLNHVAKKQVNVATFIKLSNIFGIKFQQHVAATLTKFSYQLAYNNRKTLFHAHARYNAQHSQMLSTTIARQFHLLRSATDKEA